MHVKTQSSQNDRETKITSRSTNLTPWVLSCWLSEVEYISLKKKKRLNIDSSLEPDFASLISHKHRSSICLYFNSQIKPLTRSFLYKGEKKNNIDIYKKYLIKKKCKLLLSIYIY